MKSYKTEINPMPEQFEEFRKDYIAGKYKEVS